MYERKILQALSTLNCIKTIELALKEYKAGIITFDKYIDTKNQAIDAMNNICGNAGKTGGIMPEEETMTNTG